MYINFEENKKYEFIGHIADLQEIQVDTPEIVLKYFKKVSKKLIEGEKIITALYNDSKNEESIMFLIRNMINNIKIDYHVFYFRSKQHHKYMRKDSDKRNQYFIWQMDGDKKTLILKELKGKENYLLYLKELCLN
jgi:hypothetical protein